ncbi:class F sortase [Peterkaempfera bronchialis]|uniref:Class F sortase n=1 Tax=Peterkaempfera bronchialis TaxID=2126346 RepID=A0A345T2Q0_9ACTN|nr:class F sortase [Peterkaempfera bronchialis]AXI80255.1 class F sortase [Peterkaempfera bronchialis]
MPAAAVGLLLLLLGGCLIDRAADRPAVRIAVSTAESGPGTSGPVRGGGSPRPAGPSVLAPSRPTRLVIPAAGVDAPVRDLGLSPDGTLEVPPMDRADEVGWYRNGPTPGALGPAVLVGHYDTVHGPAVFHRLPALKPGARIRILREDGTTAVFRVSRLLQYPKSGFPTDLVYGDTDGAELRLITCGGTVGADGHWTDNIIVFADLLPPRP